MKDLLTLIAWYWKIEKNTSTGACFMPYLMLKCLISFLNWHFKKISACCINIAQQCSTTSLVDTEYARIFHYMGE